VIVPFRLWHYAWLVEGGPPMGGFGPAPDMELLRFMEKTNSASLVLDGMPILCGGTIEQWKGRHIGWAWLSAKTGPNMLAATRAAVKLMDRAWGRVECTVREDYAIGHRWARMLGFTVETPVLLKYGPEGENHVGYVRFSKGE